MCDTHKILCNQSRLCNFSVCCYFSDMVSAVFLMGTPISGYITLFLYNNNKIKSYECLLCRRSEADDWLERCDSSTRGLESCNKKLMKK